MAKYLTPKDDFKPPAKIEGDIVEAILGWYFRPKYFGLENLNAKKGSLYVSNHTLMGITDGPLYIPKLYIEKKLYLRPLVDKMQKDIPIWRRLMSHYGGVIANKENCEQLMLQNQHILVFPGGTNEAFKSEGEEYQLMWKKRFGFVKMAIKNQYPIIPIAGLGGDELYDIVIDKKDIMDSFIGKWIKNSDFAKKQLKGGENIPPIIRGLGGSLLPKPKRIYYKFCDPIHTKEFKGNDSDEVLELIRLKVELAIYKGIYEMNDYRNKKGDKTNSNLRNFLTK